MRNALETARQSLHRLRDDRHGGVLPLVAMSLFMLVLAAGFGIDYARASIAKQRLQWALDAAALAGAKMAQQGDGAILATTRRYFAANYPTGFMDTGGAPVVNMSSAAAYFGAESRGYRFTVDNVRVKNYFSRLYGHNETTIAADAEVNTLPITRQDIVIAIDNSGSMQWADGYGYPCEYGGAAYCSNPPSRLESAKIAINNMIDSIPGSDVRFGLVPWDQKVNVGRGALNGVSAGDDYMISGMDASNIETGNALGPDPMVYSVYGRTPADCPPNKTTYCDRIRLQPTIYLTTDRGRVKNAVSNMSFDGNTDSAHAIIWALRQYENHHLGGWNGWQTPQMNRSIILITDGINTRFFGSAPNTDQRVITNDNTRFWCDYAKGVNPGMAYPVQSIYTIAYNMQGTPSGNMSDAAAMLQYCASSNCPGQPGDKCYFTADNQAQLQVALNLVRQTMMTMRLTK